MEINSTFNGGRIDPEAQAGRALRRLREARGWTQEEAARRMRDYGYDFHQTMIAKVEGAQRPLRVRELADFAALYGVEVQELIYAPSGSQEEADNEIAEVEAHREKVAKQARALEQRMRAAQIELSVAQAAFEKCRRDLAVQDERLRFLRGEAEKFARRVLKPDPSAVGTVEELRETLRRFWVWAGNPSFSAMAARAGGAVEPEVMARTVDGRSPLQPEIVGAVITGCGGSGLDVQTFVAAARRVTAKTPQSL